MQYYCVFGEDPVGVYSVLCTEDETGRVVWRPEFRDLECPNCGKIDEEAAVARWVPPDLRVSSKSDARRDVLLTVDNFLLVSRRFVEVMEAEAITGARLLPLPGDERFVLFIPERVPGRFELSGLEAKFPTDLRAFVEAMAAAAESRKGPPPAGGVARQIERKPEPGLKSTADNRCVACGRHFETYGFIKSVAVTPPANPRRFFTPSFNHESRGGNRFKVLCSDEVVQVLLQHELTGFRLYAMDTNVQVRRRRRGTDRKMGRGSTSLSADDVARYIDR